MRTTVGEALQQARTLASAGKLADAEAIFRRLTELLPDAGELWGELGIFYLHNKRPDAAVAPLERATALLPFHGGFQGALGASYRLVNRHDESVAAFRRAVEIGPASPDLINNLALALVKAGRNEEALAAFDSAIALRDDYQVGHFNRGMSLLSMNRPEEAVDSFQRAVQLKPEDAGAQCGLGMACFELARWDDAMAAYDRALAVQPGYQEARRNQSLVWFARGEYRKAWPAFDARLECDDYVRRRIDAPRWEGSSLAGKTLFVHAEQGLGDTLHFVRYLPLAAHVAARVWFDPQPALRPLLTQSGFADFLTPEGAPLPPFDVHSPLLSLAAHLPDDSGEPYWSGTYLKGAQGLVEHWRARLQSLDGFKIGIAWAGNAAYGYDHYRSATLANFAPLAAIPGVRLISLQRGAGCEQLTGAGEQMNLVDLGEELDVEHGAFMDSAAVIESLDLVISVDTSIGHLAGALGKPAWLALPLVADWRWLASGETSRWYPRTRLYRQKAFNDWSQVFADMAEALRKRLRSSSLPI